MYVRINNKCYEKYVPILDKLLESELKKYDLDPEYKERVYSVIEEIKESFDKYDDNGRRTKPFINFDDYLREYKMFSSMTEKCVPYVCCYIYEDGDPTFDTFLLNIFLSKMTGIEIIPPYVDQEKCRHHL